MSENHAYLFRMYGITDTGFGNSLQSKLETSSYDYENVYVVVF